MLALKDVGQNSFCSGQLGLSTCWDLEPPRRHTSGVPAMVFLEGFNGRKKSYRLRFPTAKEQAGRMPMFLRFPTGCNVNRHVTVPLLYLPHPDRLSLLHWANTNPSFLHLLCQVFCYISVKSSTPPFLVPCFWKLPAIFSSPWLLLTTFPSYGILVFSQVSERHLFSSSHKNTSHPGLNSTDCVSEWWPCFWIGLHSLVLWSGPQPAATCGLCFIKFGG